MKESEKAQDETEEVNEASMEQPAAEGDGAEQSADAGGRPEEASEADRIAALEKENAELKDQLLRRAADFDNYRKRMLREKQETAEYANSNLLADLLESLDNFDRTVEAADKAKDAKSIADGVKMISKNLVKMLEDKYSLVSYGKVGDVFNPDEHQAIGSAEGDVKEPVLKEVYLKGYKLKEKIIRHAKVMVAMPAESGSQ
ncbi:MAG: nucleotide exchange factor GrpE [Treponemataceae bacterium]|nr:nucleotide exchange factor GrpE [Treponemataceae bacterium]